MTPCDFSVALSQPFFVFFCVIFVCVFVFFLSGFLCFLLLLLVFFGLGFIMFAGWWLVSGYLWPVVGCRFVSLVGSVYSFSVARAGSGLLAHCSPERSFWPVRPLIVPRGASVVWFVLLPAFFWPRSWCFSAFARLLARWLSSLRVGALGHALVPFVRCALPVTGLVPSCAVRPAPLSCCLRCSLRCSSSRPSGHLLSSTFAAPCSRRLFFWPSPAAPLASRPLLHFLTSAAVSCFAPPRALAFPPCPVPSRTTAPCSGASDAPCLLLVFVLRVSRLLPQLHRPSHPEPFPLPFLLIDAPHPIPDIYLVSAAPPAPHLQPFPLLRRPPLSPGLHSPAPSLCQPPGLLRPSVLPPARPPPARP